MINIRGPFEKVDSIFQDETRVASLSGSDATRRNLGAMLALWIFSRLISRINYRALVWGIVGFILLLTPILSSWTGVLILVTATALGVIPATVKTARVHAMGCILLPVMLYFLLG